MCESLTPPTPILQLQGHVPTLPHGAGVGSSQWFLLTWDCPIDSTFHPVPLSASPGFAHGPHLSLDSRTPRAYRARAWGRALILTDRASLGSTRAAGWLRIHHQSPASYCPQMSLFVRLAQRLTRSLGSAQMSTGHVRCVHRAYRPAATMSTPKLANGGQNSQSLREYNVYS